jgi:hypothetical protein
VLRLFGIPVPEPDARRLVATLTADGGDLAQSAAAIIADGLDRQPAIVALPIPEREAILAVLEEPNGPLAELRGLFADATQRRLGP